MSLKGLFKIWNAPEPIPVEPEEAKEGNELIEELKKMEAYRREFLGNVSHELKTPLFNIQGYVLTLLEGGLEDPVINREYLEKTSKNIDRMIAIIEDLEVISRFESGELQLNLTRFDIGSLTAEVIELLEPKAKRKNIMLSVEGKTALVHADKDRIRQVLTNLIDNSIKYGNENGTTKIGFVPSDDRIMVQIIDNGIGMHRRDIPRVFERFYRVDKSRSREQGGSGLGLAIVKHIIEAHRQTISVQSKPGSGSTFLFSLRKV